MLHHSTNITSILLIFNVYINRNIINSENAEDECHKIIIIDTDVGLWVVTQCKLAARHHQFRRTFYFILQDICLQVYMALQPKKPISTSSLL
jgi:hypothetical protein